jgi:hypothetical protein
MTQKTNSQLGSFVNGGSLASNNKTNSAIIERNRNGFIEKLPSDGDKVVSRKLLNDFYKYSVAMLPKIIN